MSIFYFYAQSLDNQSCNDARAGLNDIAASDYELRGQIVEYIAKMKKKKYLVYKNEKFVVFLAFSFFMLEYIPSEKDVLKRVSPVFCCGKKISNSKMFYKIMQKELTEFLRNSGRSMTNEDNNVLKKIILEEMVWTRSILSMNIETIVSQASDTVYFNGLSRKKFFASRS